MLRSLPSVIADALDTLYEPNAVFRQFLGSAIISMTFFSLVPLRPLLVSSFLLLFFLFFFRFLLSFSFLSFIFFSLFLFSNWLASVVRMRSNIYYV